MEQATALRHRPTLAERARAVPRRALAIAVTGFAAYLGLMAFTTGLHPEELTLVGVYLALVCWSDGTRAFAKGLLPFLLFGIVYDLTHLTEPLVRYLHVHVEEPYRFDLTFFGIPTAHGRVTPNEFFAVHHAPLVDLVTGTAYIVFLYWSLGYAVYLLTFRRDPEGRRLLARFGWVFLLVNVAGFATYYVYPSAPPWYVAQHGFGPADFTVQADPAAALRWDALTGIHYFQAFYGRSADVFGAIPSLHVAYPLLVFLYGRPLGKKWLDLFSFAFFLLVCFSAIYLQHHYVLDVLLGITYALVGYALERLLTGSAAMQWSVALAVNRNSSPAELGDGR